VYCPAITVFPAKERSVETLACACRRIPLVEKMCEPSAFGQTQHPVRAILKSTRQRLTQGQDMVRARASTVVPLHS
jgi:hypothetical protein